MTTTPDGELAANAAARILEWAGCHNVRDTGGLPASGGGRIRPGALVRSDVLCRLTADGRAALVAHGVRTIIDVRSAEEVARDWDVYPFRADAADSRGDAARPVEYLNVPFTTGRDERVWEEIRAAYGAAQSREELNRLDVDTNGAGIAAIVRAVADAPSGGVLIHCHAGKDRTGLAVALLLALLGVSHEDIADDYAMTALNLEPLIVEWLDQMSDDEAERARLRALAEPRREAMLDTLEYLRSRYGSVEQYLRERGVSEAEVARVRARLVESAGQVGG
ncbi:tyrosine-protein phosphatase [soil metagenome]